MDPSFRFEYILLLGSILLANSTNEISNVNSELADQISESQDQQHARVDQRVIPSDGGFITSDVSLPAGDSVSESLFNHFDILKQPVKVASGSWAVASARASTIASVALPDAFGAFPYIQRQLLQVYAYYKLSMKVEVVVNTTRFHAGKLIVWYDPMDVLSSSIDKVMGVQAFTGQPHVTMDAGSSNSVCLNIPFEYILTYLSTNSSSRAPPMGTVYVSVFNPLVVATTASSDPVPVNLFLSADECDLHVPMRPHEVKFSTPSSAKAFEANAGKSDAGNYAKNGVTLKGVFSNAKAVANTAAGAWADLKSGNLSGLWTRAKDFFNLDRPANVDAKQGNMLSVLSPQAHMIGLDQCVRMGATADGNYLVSDFSSAPASDQLIKSYIQVPTLVEQITWSSTQAEDTVLDTFGVCPGLCHWEAVTGTEGTFTKEYNTNLSYVSHFFEQWRGDICFTVDFAATQFHSGRLMFVFEPNISTTPLAGVGENVQSYSNNPHLIFDLREQKKVSFTIPYVSTTPRKRTVPSQWVGVENTDEDLLGWLRILVLSPLITTENVSNSIEFNLYISAGDNFAFYAPRIRKTTRLLGDFTPTPPVEADPRGTMTSERSKFSFFANAGEEADLVSRKHEQGISLIKGVSSPPPDFYNEPITDFRDLTRRYGMYSNNTLPLEGLAGNLLGSGQFGVHPDTAFSSSSSVQSFARFVCRIFCFWTGSMRYKILPMVGNDRGIMMRATYVFGTGTAESDILGIWSAYPQVTTLTAQDKALELECPFYTPFSQLLCNQDGNYGDWRIYSPGYLNLDVFESVTDNTVTSRPFNFAFLVAAGDDIAFRLPVCAPVTWEEHLA